MIRSTLDRNADIQGYRISFYREVEFDTGEECPHAMIMFDRTARCRLIVTAEPNKSAAGRSERSHFLCAWTPEKRINYGASGTYSDLEEFMKYAALVSVRAVLLPDGVSFDDAGSKAVSNKPDRTVTEPRQPDQGSMIDWAIDRSPVIEIVRRFGGKIGESAVRKEAIGFLQRLLRDGVTTDSDADALLAARRAVQLSVHKWINDNVDHLSPEGVPDIP